MPFNFSHNLRLGGSLNCFSNTRRLKYVEMRRLDISFFPRADEAGRVTGFGEFPPLG
jgi:hypothetical protein